MAKAGDIEIPITVKVTVEQEAVDRADPAKSAAYIEGIAEGRRRTKKECISLLEARIEDASNSEVGRAFKAAIQHVIINLQLET